MSFAQLHPEGDGAIRREANTETDAEAEELFQLIDERLPAALRATYLRMRAGEKLSIDQRERVEQAVPGILKEAGLGVEDIGLGRGPRRAG